MSRRTVTILGATGSVGKSTLDLIERHPDRYEVVALTARRDVRGLAEAARRVSAKRAVIAEDGLHSELQEALAGTDIEVGSGCEAVVEAAGAGAEWTMAAIVGIAGLRPVMEALRSGKVVALANKEALVTAGDLVIATARNEGAALLPVDSEHNAIFQCFDAQRPQSVRRITLTASGGPFRTRSLEEMRSVTPEQAVAHPNWSMGAKISVDSATLMNKGLEVIEAFHLFPLQAEQFDVVIHPQSVVHSLVEYADGSVLAQLGAADMRIPISYALAWPERMETPCERLDLARIGTLSFEEPDLERFPALGLAKEALRLGGANPAILNAANELAVASFLDRKLAFLDIAAVVSETLQRYHPPAPTSLDEVFAVDEEARRIADNVARRLAN
jgi:1-deoxy-D-xylulose-5-phosphate reductoisomerase